MKVRCLKCEREMIEIIGSYSCGGCGAHIEIEQSLNTDALPHDPTSKVGED